MLLRQFLAKIKNTPDRVFSVYLMKNHQGKNLTYEEWSAVVEEIKKKPAH